MRDYTDTEFLICLTARLIEDGSTVFVGYGIPQIAAILGQKLYAPDIVQVYEYGAIGPEVATPFRRNMMADARNSYRALWWTTMNFAMANASAGFVDYGILGAAQIDPYGNINSTIVGSYERPEVRFTGSGGGNEVASLCWRTIIVLQQEKRRFLPKVDFITSPGYLTGPGAREEAGLPKNTGPYRVITTKAVFDFPKETCRMRLIARRSDVSIEEILGNMGFKPDVSEEVNLIEPPKDEELKLLREEIDPERIVIGKI